MEKARGGGTKKGLILELARRDPFLSVEDIARAASTTGRYVRTALSEKAVSLRLLRTQMARSMEQELSLRGGAAQAPGTGTVPPATVEAVVEPRIASLLGRPEGEPLMHVRRAVPGDPPVVEDLYTASSISLGDTEFGLAPGEAWQASEEGPSDAVRSPTAVRGPTVVRLEHAPGDAGSGAAAAAASAAGAAPGAGRAGSGPLLLVVETVLVRDGRPFAVEMRSADAGVAEVTAGAAGMRFRRARR